MYEVGLKPTFLLYTGFENMGNLEEKLYKLIQPICDAEKICIDNVSVNEGGRNKLVKIIVDTDSGIRLSQCQDLSKKISDIFFRKDIFHDAYRLEVSSPGINKPLENSFEFRRNIGKDLHVNYRKDDEIKSITGKLVTFDGKEITVQQKDDKISISLLDIDEAKIKLKW